jgi:hypothetical protein
MSFKLIMGFHDGEASNVAIGELFALLLALNLDLAAKERAGKKITPPGLRLPAKEHGAFITTDCIQVAENP